MAYSNVQNSGKQRTNTGATITWTPGSAPTVNNLLTLRCWGWNGGGGYSPGTTDARDSSGTPVNFTRDSPLPTVQGGGNAAIYSLVVPSGLTTPVKNVNTSTALIGIFDEWSGNATSSVVDQANSGSVASVAAGATAGASITTGANAGLVLTSVMDTGSGGAVSLVSSGTNFSTDASEQDNNSWQAGLADRRTTSVASATLNDIYARGSGSAARVNVIVSYNLSSGATTGYRDATTRIRVAATAFRDATARVRAAARAFRDATARLRVAATSWRDATARVRVAATAYRDATARIRASVRGFRDATARVAVRIQGFRDATARVRTAATAYRDTTIRLVVLGVAAGYRDATVRIRAAVRGFRDANARVAVRVGAYRDSTLRLRVVGPGYRDAGVRLRSAVRAVRDSVVRIVLRVAAVRDVALRVLVRATATRDAVVRFVVAGPTVGVARHTATDQALFEHAISDSALFLHTIADQVPGS